jgi:hypothetical protein
VSVAWRTGQARRRAGASEIVTTATTIAIPSNVAIARWPAALQADWPRACDSRTTRQVIEVVISAYSIASRANENAAATAIAKHSAHGVPPSAIAAGVAMASPRNVPAEPCRNADCRRGHHLPREAGPSRGVERDEPGEQEPCRDSAGRAEIGFQVDEEGATDRNPGEQATAQSRRQGRS